MTVLSDTIEYHELIKYDGEDFVIGKCTFLIDFGPWKKGEKCEYIEIDFEECVIREYDFKNQTILKTGEFKIISK